MSALLAHITLDYIYYLLGIYLFVFAAFSLADKKNPKRFGNAAFWGVYGLTFAFGKMLPPVVVGGCVVFLTLLAAAKKLGPGNYGESSKEEKLEGMKRFGGWIFIPALFVPVGTYLFVALFKMSPLISFGFCSFLALVIAMLMVREGPLRASQEGRRMCDAINWALILPQFLAALGVIFEKAGVGVVISGLVSAAMPGDVKLLAVIAYCVGMALFTMVMGNAFAAFAVITAGIGLPLVVRTFGADPAIAGVLAMTSGYCGTLLTPMAANFNVVPAALLEMENKNGVIKAQAGVALTMLCINIALMYFLAF